MGKQDIEQKSFWYNLLYRLVKTWHHKVYYRKVLVLGEENIPADAKIIFTPNHQNALMDALALLFTIKRQLVFVARADIFKNPKIAAILYFLKILPVYRIRDGFDSLKKNKETFDKTVDVLNAGNGLVILPEGNHAGSRRLRPLKKGFARIAFQTEELNDFKLDIKIIPVGLDYSNYYVPQEVLIVNFGKPISISDYKETYINNAPLALNKIKESLSKAMSRQMVDIRPEKDVNFIELIIKILLAKKYPNGISDSEIEESFAYSRRKAIELSNLKEEDTETYSTIIESAKKLGKGLKNSNISAREFALKACSPFKMIGSLITILVFSPVYIYSLILNFIPFQLSINSPRLIKDPQFKSSFKLVVSLLLFPLFYMLQTLLIFGVFSIEIHWSLFVLSQIIAAAIAWPLHFKMAFSYRMFKVRMLKKFRKSTFIQLRNLQDKILKFFPY